MARGFRLDARTTAKRSASLPTNTNTNEDIKLHIGASLIILVSLTTALFCEREGKEKHRFTYTEWVGLGEWLSRGMPGQKKEEEKREKNIYLPIKAAIAGYILLLGNKFLKRLYLEQLKCNNDTVKMFCLFGFSLSLPAES